MDKRERYVQGCLDGLVAESIHVFREVVAQFANPVMLYSVGKDSSVMLDLARRAFAPGKIPFPLLHVDTGYKFREMLEFRDAICAEMGAELIVHRNEDAISEGAHPSAWGSVRCCGALKTLALLDALAAGGYDAAFGGARRDEERSRAKERFFSFRDAHGQWDPKNQRPELWSLYNGRISPGESIRVFPISNWTERDVWAYIDRENVPVVPMYFAKPRPVIDRNGLLIPVTESTRILPGETITEEVCRFRTLGCSPCTGAVRSDATTVADILAEMDDLRHSERITRVIDHDQDGSMEQKKREGYF